MPKIRLGKRLETIFMNEFLLLTVVIVYVAISYRSTLQRRRTAISKTITENEVPISLVERVIIEDSWHCFFMATPRGAGRIPQSVREY